MKRITVEDVRKAYAATDFIPDCSSHLRLDEDGQWRGSPFGALYVHQNGFPKTDHTTIGQWAVFEYSSSYVNGVMYGFDGGKPITGVHQAAFYIGNFERFKEGYADGRAAAEAMFGEGK